MDDRAKSEARRKKILDNAEARLMKITGRKRANVSPVTNSIEEPKSNSASNNIVHNVTVQNFSTEPLTSTVPSAVEEDKANHNCIPKEELNSQKSEVLPENEIPPSSQPIQEEQSGSIPKRTFWNDYILFVCLAVLVRTSYLYGFSWTFGENMLVPLIVCGLPRLIFITGTTHHEESILFTLLRMRGFSQSRLNALTSAYLFFRHLLVLSSLYIFTFVIFHCVLESIPVS